MLQAVFVSRKETKRAIAGTPADSAKTLQIDGKPAQEGKCGCQPLSMTMQSVFAKQEC